MSNLTALDNLEFPWQPEDPIPWQATSFDFVAHTDRWFITADITLYYQFDDEVTEPWKAYASVYDYRIAQAFRHQSWHPTAEAGKAAAEQHIREHAS